MFFDSILLNYLLMLVLLVSLTFDYVTKFFKYWYVRHISYKTPIPFFGSDYHRIAGLRNTTEEVNTLYYQHREDKLVGSFKSRIPDLIVKDPEMLKTILSTDFKNFSSRGIGLDKCRDVCLRNNLFYADGEKWTILRERLVKILYKINFKFEDNNPCFSGIKGDTNVQQLVASILDNIFSRILIDDYANLEEEAVITDVRLIASNKSLLSKFTSYIKNIFPSVYVLFDLIKYRNCSATKTYEILKNSKLIKEIKETSVQASLSAKEKYTSKHKMDPDVEFASSVLTTFVIEGLLPCQHLLTALIYELSRNPKIQDTARASITNKQDSYLTNIIKETLRLHPPFSIVTRKCVKSYKFVDTDLLLDKNVTVAVPIEAIHSDSRFYTDPKIFNPDRFSKSEEPSDSFTYLPFGVGQRKCPGEELALQIAESVTRAILKNYVIKPTEGTPHQLPVIDLNFGRVIDGDIWLKFTKINEN